MKGLGWKRWLKGDRGFGLSLWNCSSQRLFPVIMWAIWSCQISKMYCSLIDGLNTPGVPSTHIYTILFSHSCTRRVLNACKHTYTQICTYIFKLWWAKQNLENYDQRWGLWCTDKGCNFNFTRCQSPQYLFRWNTYELPITHKHKQALKFTNDNAGSHLYAHILIRTFKGDFREFILSFISTKVNPSVANQSKQFWFLKTCAFQGHVWELF